MGVSFGVNNSWIILGKHYLAWRHRAPPELEAALGILQGKPAGFFVGIYPFTSWSRGAFSRHEGRSLLSVRGLVWAGAAPSAILPTDAIIPIDAITPSPPGTQLRCPQAGAAVGLQEMKAIRITVGHELCAGKAQF